MWLARGRRAGEQNAVQLQAALFFFLFPFVFGRSSNESRIVDKREEEEGFKKEESRGKVSHNFGADSRSTRLPFHNFTSNEKKVFVL